MAKNRTAQAGVYLNRLANNEYVQERLVEAADDMLAAYKRATKRRSATKAAQDKKVQQRVKHGAEAARDALKTIQTGRRPKSHRSRKVALAVVAAAGAGAVAAGPVRRKLAESDGSMAPQAFAARDEAAPVPPQPVA